MICFIYKTGLLHTLDFAIGNGHYSHDMSNGRLYGLQFYKGLIDEPFVEVL